MPKRAGLAAAIGIGINVALAPQDTGRPVAALGLAPDACAAVFDELARAFVAWLGRWDDGCGFAGLLDAWRARAHVIGEPLNVSLNGSSIRGRFHGLDERGALQLQTDTGVVITVNAGDITPAPQG